MNLNNDPFEHEAIGLFTQLPMKLAWAITIHKSQGQTLDRVVVDLSGGTFANGQLYVALSRGTSLEGLVLKRDVRPRDLKTDIRVRRYLTGAGAKATSLGRVFISILQVGQEWDRYRLRPIEIAVVMDDGDEATTVVSPTSDLYSA